MPYFLDFLKNQNGVAPWSESTLKYSKEAVEEYNRSIETSKTIIMEILQKCQKEHGFRFRIWAINSDLVEVALATNKLLKSNVLNVGIVKLIKVILKSKDETYIKYFTKKKMFGSLI